MASVNGRLEKVISNFFNAGASTSREQCDEFAERQFGGPIEPVPAQGVYSYTVTAAGNTRIVQFRDPNSPLDTRMFAALKIVHEGFVVAVCRLEDPETDGSPRGLLVYTMDKLPGVNYLCMSLSLPSEGSDLQVITVRSLARFFAQSWRIGTALPDQAIISAVANECYFNFDHLAADLPPRFHPTITQIRENLPRLFSVAYPNVITHGDLSEANILANPATGEITGIIDWAEAGLQPFGFALYALDNILGYLTLDGWVFYGNAEHLWGEFWRMFRELVGELSQEDMELIQLARLVGLFLRYGFARQPGCKGVVGMGGDPFWPMQKESGKRRPMTLLHWHSNY